MLFNIWGRRLQKIQLNPREGNGPRGTGTPAKGHPPGLSHSRSRENSATPFGRVVTRERECAKWIRRVKEGNLENRGLSAASSKPVLLGILCVLGTIVLLVYTVWKSQANWKSKLLQKRCWDQQDRSADYSQYLPSWGIIHYLPPSHILPTYN